MASVTKLDILIVDSGAIIRGHGLGFHNSVANDGIYTVHEVLSEIRDSKARELLNNLPFELHVRHPSDEAMRAVASFAKKTGDFSTLSLTDLKLLALCYTFDIEITGGHHIREEPVRSIGSDKKNANSSKKTSNTRQENPIAFEGIADGSYQSECNCGDITDSNNEHIENHSKQPGVGETQQGEEEGAEPAVNSVSLQRQQQQEETHEDDDEGDIEEYVENEKDVYDDEVEEEEEDCADDDNDEDHNNDIGEEQVVHYEEAEAEGEVSGNTDIQLNVPEDCVAEKDANTSTVAIIPQHKGSNEDGDCVGITLATSQLVLGDGEQAAAITSSTKGAVKSWASIASKAPVADIIPSKPHSKDVVEVIPRSSNMSAKAGVDFFGVASGSSSVSAAERESHTPSAEGGYSSRILLSGGGVSRQAMDRFAAEDDGVGWINADNITSVKATGNSMLGSTQHKSGGDGAVVAVESARVACVTTDYSMQNVLLQMKLSVMSVDGLLVRQVKQWVLRCSACYKIHTDMQRLFCSKCGTNHLHRIATSIDAATGVMKLHLKKDFKVNTRGKIYPLPRPGQQGKYEGEILLREDQLLSGIWRQKVVKINRDVRSAFGADIVSDLGLQLNKGSAIKVGLGRTNPNADKGRSKRGKSNKKH